ncbi:MAG: extracellular solute-binding protein [Candidatus Eisenbacteria bacterium]
MRPLFLPILLLTVPLAIACGGSEGGPERIRFWAMGREGEVVQELVRDFERENPDVRVEVQQIPWSAAHEKLLTAHVGDSTPDVAQLGNTWVGEFVALRALEPLGNWIDRSEGIEESIFFDGIWDTNVLDGEPYGIPWYVDTRVLFYRKDILAEAGYDEVPGSWSGWRRAMEAVKGLGGEDRYALFLPTNEFTQPILFGLQAGSTLLAENDTRGDFTGPAFREAFHFLIDLYRDGLAPPVGNTEISNLYEEFAKGYFAMYITGPWNLGEFERRLPADLQDDWATAPLPGPEGIGSAVSLAGGGEPRPLPELGTEGRRVAARGIPLGAGAAGPLLRTHRRPPGEAGGMGRSGPRREREDPRLPGAAEAGGGDAEDPRVGADRHAGDDPRRRGDPGGDTTGLRPRRPRQGRGPDSGKAPVDDREKT